MTEAASPTRTPRPTGTWDPNQYLRYAHNRRRPFQDLLARIPDLPSPAPRITDLGCGPGNVTSSLFDRWPNARITGVDTSAEMLKAAAEHAGPAPDGNGNLTFELGDVRTWTAEEPHDLIISNATLQWVPNHHELFPAWLDHLLPGGTLAFQVPGNFTSPSHALLHDVASRPRWRDRLTDIVNGYVHILKPAGYLNELTALGCTVDAWETTYVHLLQGEDPVLNWVKGTALRPVFSMLDDPEDRHDFLAQYAELLRHAYPKGAAGTIFPFRRIFAIARKEPMA